ncbi:RNA polymerase sigma-H factor [Dyadobacter sp. CECT 9275]|uniref:RNA polymerase sigma factor n=1 Tax=Dyadobacter helix TaxID=2822344 RepID=A0A916JBY2_9BACT|nr:RNA polymerase sigma-70 factor [Dyadobacter sp. CECT 9275]CAG5000694.1 RNA polymerase sigma-H factor [Dyadobacter sp. CECT 9275]
MRSLDNEAELLFEISLGNESAFRVVYDYYSAGIFRVSKRYLQSAELAEDVVQETFLTIWLKRSEIVRIQSFRAYLFSITKNICLKYLRDLAEKSHTHREFSERAELWGNDTVDEYQLLLHQAVQKLPPQQKQIFELGKVKGLGHIDIARILNISPYTVSNHMTAALKSIRKHLQHHIAGLISVIASFL